MITIFVLDNNKIIRSRTVYSIITLISEVIGLSELIFTGVAFLMGLLYTPLMLEAALLDHMGPCILP